VQQASHHEGHRFWFYMATGAPTVSLLLTVWGGGIMTQALIEDLHPYLPRPVDLRRKSMKEKFLGTFRYPDLLAARNARGLARALGPGPHRPLRAGKD